MNKLLNIGTGFVHWVYLILKKWVWAIGLPLPILDLLSLYVPGFPQISISWQLSVSVIVCGFIISAFLVYRDQELHLAELLENEPQFKFQLSDISQKICEGDKIHLECNIRISSHTAWLGILDNISLEAIKLPEFMGSGEISGMQYQAIGWHCPNVLKLPYQIPQNGVDIGLEMHFPYENIEGMSKNKPKGRGSVNLCFLIGFQTPARGYLQKCERVKMPLDFGSIEQLILHAQEQSRQIEGN